MIFTRNQKIVLAIIVILVAVFFGLLGRSIIKGFQRLMDGERYDTSPDTDPTTHNSNSKPVHALCVLVLSFYMEGASLLPYSLFEA